MVSPFSVEVTDTSAKGEGRIRRNKVAAKGDLLSKPRENVSTVYELVQYSIQKFGDKNCMGHRNVLKEHTEEKMLTKMVDGHETQVPKKWTFWELSPYIYRTFKQVGEESASLGAGLRNLGLNPGDRIELYAGTSYLPHLQFMGRHADKCDEVLIGNLWLRVRSRRGYI